MIPFQRKWRRLITTRCGFRVASDPKNTSAQSSAMNWNIGTAISSFPLDTLISVILKACEIVTPLARSGRRLPMGLFQQKWRRLIMEYANALKA